MIRACVVTPTPDTYISFCNELNFTSVRPKIDLKFLVHRVGFWWGDELKGAIRLRKVFCLASTNDVHMHLNFNWVYIRVWLYETVFKFSRQQNDGEKSA